MAYITVQQHAGEAPLARVVTADNGDRFISIDFGRAATVLLHGENAEAVANARALAHALLDAANQIEEALPLKQEQEPDAVRVTGHITLQQY